MLTEEEEWKNAAEEDGSFCLNEKGCAAVLADEWNSLLLNVFPDTPRQQVYDAFGPLYDRDPENAFRFAMMFGNLRKGGGGRTNMNAFFACMEVVWAKNPRHLVANVKGIMDHVSCKAALTLLKHLSNHADQSSPNNYWGNLQRIEDRANLRKSFAAKDRARRIARAQGHMRVLQEFVDDCLGPPFRSIMQVLQPKAWVKKKTVPLKRQCLVPRTPLIAERFDLFRKRMHPMLEELEEQWCVAMALDCSYLFQSMPSSDAFFRCSVEEQQEWQEEDEKEPLPLSAGTNARLEERRMACLFAAYHAHNKEILQSIADSQRASDPVVFVASFSPDGDECSVASTAADLHDDGDGSSSCSVYKFFSLEYAMQDPRGIRVPYAGTKVAVNPLSGYEVVPELDAEFRAFVAARDRRLKAEASAARKKMISMQRDSPGRSDPCLVALFWAVVDAFELFLQSDCEQRRMFAFKYCPTPGCSADKGTGNADTGGIGQALMGCLFPGIQSREFKEWVACFRRGYGIAESFIGCRQIKQIRLRGAPSMHLSLWGSRIHERHNPEGYKRFKEEAIMRLKEGRKGVNASQLMPHELLRDVESGNSLAELQLLSIIQQTKVPDSVMIMPIIDVSGSMSGPPMEVAVAMGIVAAYCQSPESPFYRMFMTFDEKPSLYSLPPLLFEEPTALGKIASCIRDKPWGGSTNFFASMKLMLQELDRASAAGGGGGGAAADEARTPIVMVFTDMQFDEADGGGAYETCFESVERMFAERGVPMPLVVFWNVRGTPSSLAAAAAAPTAKRNVVMLSGFSADLMQDFFSMLSSGQFRSAQEECCSVGEEDFPLKKAVQMPSTEDVIRLVLDSDMYMSYRLPQ
jgi:hypothetical protein